MQRQRTDRERRGVVPVAPIRAAVLNSDVSFADVCRAIGFVRIRSDRRSPAADMSRLRRTLGIDPMHRSGFATSVMTDVARRICEAVGTDLEAVLAAGPQVCACGEELVGSPDGLCGFCREERTGVAA